MYITELTTCYDTQEYESIYKASLAVQSFPQNRNGTGNARRKRTDDSDDEEGARYVYIAHYLLAGAYLNAHCRVEDRKRQLVDDDDDDDMMME